MIYAKTSLQEEIIVKNIVSIHYFEFAKDYAFKGEKHDFWEFVYADKGEIGVMADTKSYLLKHGEVIFHKPNEFHNLQANGRTASNVVVISFECKSKAIKAFENKIASINDLEKNLLAQIIKEGKETFSGYTEGSVYMLKRKTTTPAGCEQLIKISLEQFLLSLSRRDAKISATCKLSSSVKEGSDGDKIKNVISFLNDKVEKNLTFEDVRVYSKLSKTNLNSIFRKSTGSSVMEYFKKLKIEEAKKMIREGQLNITEIAEKLGYQSIHYFSRQFKKISNMSPTEYAVSIQAKI